MYDPPNSWRSSRVPRVVHWPVKVIQWVAETAAEDATKNVTPFVAQSVKAAKPEEVTRALKHIDEIFGGEEVGRWTLYWEDSSEQELSDLSEHVGASTEKVLKACVYVALHRQETAEPDAVARERERTYL